MTECTRFETYLNPFSSRYASREMGFLFSDQFKYSSFRKLWYELAKAQKKLGLSIPKAALDQMKKHENTIDFESVMKREKVVKHDVMAHIQEFASICPKAAPYIHLGATSCFVTDNTDLIVIKKAFFLFQEKLFAICKILSDFAQKTKNVPCVSYTHLQPAQPTTVGKRACLWLQDFFIDLKRSIVLKETFPFLGAKGATGTQNSFLQLFQGNHKKVVELDELLTKAFGFQRTLLISGQTYSRKIDVEVLHRLGSFAASAHKFATDFRILCHMKELQEKATSKQVGSSAMPHKQNPIYSERICGMARFVISLTQNPLQTLSTQWLERTLDDSSNRRLVIPQAFLAVDSILNLIYHVLKGLQLNRKKVQENFQKELPKLILENILMHAASFGEDRQKIHEKLRKLSQKNAGLKEFCKIPEFHLTAKTFRELSRPESFIGRAKEQTEDFLKQEVNPVLKRFSSRRARFTRIEL